MNKRSFAIVDVETTGARSLEDRVIEIAILKVIDGELVDFFQTLLNPGCFLPFGITGIIGITDEDLASAPSFIDVEAKIAQMLEGSIFVAHNSQFDYSFVKAEFKRVGREFKARQLCTVKLSRILFPKRKSHNLDSIIKRYGFTCQRRHRAEDDAKVLFEFLKVVREKFGDEKLEEAMLRAGKMKGVPGNIDPQQIENLPEGPGVYIFKDEKGEPLYIGKSISIRNRVLSHFSAKERDEKELKLSLFTHHIETRETPGELSALLLESKLIKEMEPLYNRLLRRKKSLLILRSRKNEKGFFVPCFEVSSDEYDIRGVLGIFRSKYQLTETLRKVTKENKLCEKLMGTEKGKGPCFHLGFGECHGACVGSEEPQNYNKRFLEAWRARRIRTWPYEGAILIEEKKSDEEGEAHIVDSWRLVKSVTYNGYGEENTVNYENRFEYDAYKILARYLLNAKNRKHIKPFREPEEKKMALEFEW